MNVYVRLLHYASKMFTYDVPDALKQNIEPGVLVQVPLGKKVVSAVVERIAGEHETFNFEIKSILAVFPFPQDTTFKKFIYTMAQYYQVDELILLKRLQLFLAESDFDAATIPAVALAEEHKPAPQDVVFTSEQEQVYQAIAPYIFPPRHEIFALHGVTGSGKTEVYKKLIAQVVAQGKAAILLLPEVTLALRFEKLLKKSFEHVAVIGFHSASTAAQKKALWQLLLEQKPVIIIGVHLPILLPIAHLGIIIVDEEHDHGYQEKKHPKIHTRDMAILKASMHHIPIVLGSATPSISTLWNVQHKNWKLLRMQERFAGTFPQVRMVSLQKGQKRKNAWIHQELYLALQDCLQREQQAIIFLNRRGYSFFVQCGCSFVFHCQACSVSLTLHERESLICHYCGHREYLPPECPSCHAESHEFIKKGIGTQQVVAMLQDLFPNARIARADLDSTSKKRSWAQTVEDMYEKRIDILVGTQSITKGYHFPGVTLVGVLWADLNLHFPMYNAAEITLQQLIQVAGRAGRQSGDSLVIVQSFDQHEIFQYIDEKKYVQFYEHEIERRIAACYPPYGHILEIELKLDDMVLLEQEGRAIVQEGQKFVDRAKYNVCILGPVPAIVHKIKKIYAIKIVLKSMSRQQMLHVFWHLRREVDIHAVMHATIDPV